jgi:hypothetical protein
LEPAGAATAPLASAVPAALDLGWTVADLAAAVARGVTIGHLERILRTEHELDRLPPLPTPGGVAEEPTRISSQVGSPNDPACRMMVWIAYQGSHEQAEFPEGFFAWRVAG